MGCDKAMNDKIQNNRWSVHVGNLARNVDKNMLKNCFSDCGEVVQIWLSKDDKSRLRYCPGDRQSFAFIEFRVKAGVDAAVKLDGMKLSGQIMRVMKAGTMPDKGRRGNDQNY